MLLCPRRSHVDLLGNCKGIVNLDAEIAHGAFDLGMAQQQLDGTQISGATVMQLGFTSLEKMNLDGGQVTNASLADYKVPGIYDIPPMEVDMVDTVQKNGPFGAKGIGESGTFGVSPAIANAIHDAAGVRIWELPLTPEVVLRAIRAAEGRPLAAAE